MNRANDAAAPVSLRYAIVTAPPDERLRELAELGSAVHYRGLVERMRDTVAVVQSRRLVLLWLLTAWAAAAGCATPVPTSGEEPATRAVSASFAVYALSRGRGVPEPTRSAWQAVWTMLEDARREGTVTRLQQTRIGLEGEVRLCAEFSGPEREREMLERAREIGKGVELLNIVEEPCSGQ